jgi:hypothetical protein
MEYVAGLRGLKLLGWMRGIGLTAHYIPSDDEQNASLVLLLLHVFSPNESGALSRRGLIAQFPRLGIPHSVSIGPRHLVCIG